MPSIAVLGRVCPVTGELSVAYTRRHPIKHALTIKVRGTGRVVGWRDRIENIGKVDILGRVAWRDLRPKPWVIPEPGGMVSVSHSHLLQILAIAARGNC